MKNYTVIANNGEIIANGFCDESTYQENIEAVKTMYGGDCFHLDDVSVSPDIFYFKNGKFFEYPEKPIRLCHFDFENEVWVIEIDKESNLVRQRRDVLLLQSDWTDSAQTRLGNEKFLKWQEYRQALRDIPQQAGFPLDVVWPTKPE